jgi:hypothetical protein
MHLGHDHTHQRGNGAAAGTHSIGHNHAPEPKRAVQWQTPHLLPGVATPTEATAEPDLDLVETAFAESFAVTTDPTSFLRLAQIPFEARNAEGERLVLLRVESEAVTDVGSVMPQLGGGDFRYDPLPAVLVARRRRLRFVYGDGRTPRALTFAEVRELTPI